MTPDHEADREFDEWRSADAAENDPILRIQRAAFRGGWEAQAAVCRHIDEVATAESVAQMAAGDRDEALENFARAEHEIERLEGLLRRIHDAAKNGIEGKDDYEVMREIEMLSGED